MISLAFGLVEEFANDSTAKLRLVGGRAERIGFKLWPERKANTTVYLHGKLRQPL